MGVTRKPGITSTLAVGGIFLVRPERFELPTCCSGGNRSIQLSYGRVCLQFTLVGERAAMQRGPALFRLAVGGLPAVALAATTSPAAFAAVTAATPTELCLGACLVHIDCATANLTAVQSRVCFFPILIVVHLDE